MQLSAHRPDGRPAAAFAADVEAEKAALIEQAAKGPKAQTIRRGSFAHCGSGDDGDDTSVI